MKRFNSIFIGVLAIVCALYLFFSAQMSMGSLSRPGPGFVPTVLGVIGLVVSLIVLAGSIRDLRSTGAGKAGAPGQAGTKATAAVDAEPISAERIGTIDVGEAVVAAETAPVSPGAAANPECPVMDRAGFMRFLGYLIASIVFIPMLNYLGAVITIFALILALTKISGAGGWIKPIVFAAICSATAYAVFELALHVSLPRGIF